MCLIVGGKTVRRRIRRNHFYFAIILILFASIGVGYAALTSTISINGTTQITSAKWDVHFANYSLGANTSGNCAQPSITENGTKLTISKIGLSAGTEVEYYVDVVNAGTIDARLSSVIKSKLTPGEKYLKYTVTYGFNMPIKENDLLKAGTSERIRISIVYSDDKTLAPTTQETVSDLTFKIDYVQDKGNGVARARLCKRATTLHTGTVGTSTTTVNYGQIGTSGKLASGDAFDCDVNGDGKYDAATERFYYVTDLDGDANTAVLIFYGNSDSSGVYLINRANYSSNNYSGPTTIVRQLPTTSAWPRVGLIKNTSQIYNDKGGTTAAHSTNTTTTHNLPKYTYRTAARLLTYQEYQKITDNSFLWENFGDGGQMAGCIWLNTPQDSTGMDNAVFAISNPTGSILAAMPYNGASKLCGPRPVIEVLKTDMIY